MGYVYFVQERKAGSYLIKIGATAGCPYLRLSQLRNSAPKESFELLGCISVEADQHSYWRTKQHELHNRFQELRAKGEKSAWFRPGLQLVEYIQAHARPHFCDLSCCDTTSIEEEMRARDAEASAAFQAVVSTLKFR